MSVLGSDISHRKCFDAYSFVFVVIGSSYVLTVVIILTPMKLANLGRWAFLLFLLLSTISLFLLPKIGKLI